RRPRARRGAGPVRGVQPAPRTLLGPHRRAQPRPRARARRPRVRARPRRGVPHRPRRAAARGPRLPEAGPVGVSLDRALHALMRRLETLIGGILALMVVLVFGNVVLRYGFNSGIAISEEISRYLFIWLTFLGAIVAVHEHEHLGVDTLVR